MSREKKYAFITLVVLLVAALIVFIILSQTDKNAGTVDGQSLKFLTEAEVDDWSKHSLPEWAPGPESNDPDIIMMVGVFIRSTDTEKRNLLRSSLFRHPIFSGKKPRANIRFIIGHSKDEDMDAIREEMMEYQDMVLLPFRDSYDNLGIKSMLFFECYSHAENNYQFIMKIDDDTYFNFDYMTGYLDTTAIPQKRHYWYIGSMLYGTIPYRDPDHKYCTPYEEFPYDVFPTYASGGGYILSKPLAKKITDMDYKIIHIEDANTGYRIQRGRETGAFEEDVQYVDITYVYSSGRPVFFSQIEPVEQVKEAYSNDF